MSNRPSSLLGALEDQSGVKAGEPLEFQSFAGPEQLDLLRDKDGHLPPGALRKARMQMQARGPGRPQGSRNKRSQDVAKWYLNKFPDPLLILGEITAMPLDVLYENMVLAQGGEHKTKRLTGKDAVAMRINAAIAALPFIHQKLPMAVELSTDGAMILNIPGLTDMAGVAERLGSSAMDDLDDIEDVDFDIVEPDLLTDGGGTDD